MYLGGTPATSDVQTADTVELGSDLVVLAARLVRVVRRTQQLPAGFRVLSLLDELGPQGVGALAAADHCSQPTMTAAVRGLARSGWVTKEPHPTDARSSVVTLTATGTAELHRVRRRSGEAVAAHTTRTTEELATAVAVLVDLLDRPPRDPVHQEGRPS